MGTGADSAAAEYSVFKGPRLHASTARRSVLYMLQILHTHFKRREHRHSQRQMASPARSLVQCHPPQRRLSAVANALHLERRTRSGGATTISGHPSESGLRGLRVSEAAAQYLQEHDEASSSAGGSAARPSWPGVPPHEQRTGSISPFLSHSAALAFLDDLRLIADQLDGTRAITLKLWIMNSRGFPLWNKRSYTSVFHPCAWADTPEALTTAASLRGFSKVDIHINTLHTGRRILPWLATFPQLQEVQVYSHWRYSYAGIWGYMSGHRHLNFGWNRRSQAEQRVLQVETARVLAHVPRASMLIMLVLDGREFLVQRGGGVCEEDLPRTAFFSVFSFLIRCTSALSGRAVFNFLVVDVTLSVDIEQRLVVTEGRAVSTPPLAPIGEESDALLRKTRQGKRRVGKKCNIADDRSSDSHWTALTLAGRQRRSA
ncbi:hypothetical protein C8F01DRAFT_1082245 [Mycena amicta]|nr:hypothetical protein C8F01DRAFT_1082245 [Mycena amicta]